MADESKSKTDPAPPITNQDIWALLIDLDERSKKDANDRGIIYPNIFSKLGEITDKLGELCGAVTKAVNLCNNALEQGGRIISRVESVETIITNIEYQITARMGEIVDLLSVMPRRSEFDLLKSEVSALSATSGAAHEMDEEGRSANQEISSGSR